MKATKVFNNFSRFFFLLKWKFVFYFFEKKSSRGWVWTKIEYILPCLNLNFAPICDPCYEPIAVNWSQNVFKW